MSDINLTLGIDQADFKRAEKQLNDLLDADFDFSDIDKALSQLDFAIDEIELDIDTKDAKKQIDKFEKANDEIDVDLDLDTKDAEGKVTGLRKQFAGLSDSFISGFAGGAGFAIVTSALEKVGAAATQALNSYREFDSQVQNIATLNAVEDLDGLKEVLNDVSTTTVDDASVLAAATYQALSAGVSGSNDELGKFVQTASKVATAGGSDAETAVDALTTVMNSFKIETADADKVSDQFFATIKAGKTDFGQLSSSLSNVTGAASSAGLEFGEVAASIATLTAQGIPTAQATTKIRGAIVALQKPNKDTAELFKQMGLSVSDVAEILQKPVAEGGGLTNFLQDLEKQASANGKSFTQLFSSVEASGAALALTGENAALANKNLKAVLEDSAGSAEFAYEEAAKSIDNQLGLIAGSIQAIFNNIFITLEPLILGFLSTVGGGIDLVASGFANFSSILETIAPLAIGLATAFALQNKELIINQTLTTAKLLKDKAVIALTKGWTVAQGLLNAVLNANPLGLVVLAIGALVTGIKLAYENSETFRNILDALYENTLKPIVEGFLDLANSVGEFLGLIDDTDETDKQINKLATSSEELAKSNNELADSTKKLDESLENQGKTLESLQSEIEQYKTQIKQAVEAGDAKKAAELSQELKTTQKEYDKLNKEISKYIPSQEKSIESTEKQKTGIEKLNDRIKELKTNLENAIFEGNTQDAIRYRQELNLAEKQLQKFKTELEILSKIDFDLDSLVQEIDGVELGSKTGKDFNEAFRDSLTNEVIPAPKVDPVQDDFSKDFSENLTTLFDDITQFEQVSNSLANIGIDNAQILGDAFKESFNTISFLTDNAEQGFNDYAESVSNAVGLLSQSLEEGTALQKAAAITEATINSYLAFTQVLADPTIQPSFLKPVFAGVILAQGISQISKIAGAETGVIGIDENYNGKVGKTDTIPVMVAKNESIISEKGTRSNIEALTLANKGINVAEHYKAQSRIDMSETNDILKNVDRHIRNQRIYLVNNSKSNLKNAVFR